MADKDFVVKNGLVTGTNTVSLGTALNVLSSGNVGIGNTAPTAALHITKVNTSGSSQDMLKVNYSAAWGLRLAQNYVGAGDIKYELKATYNSIEYDVLTFKNGNIGINNTTPARKLDVTGDMNIANVYSTGTINATALTTGSVNIINASGIYTTGTINSASYTVGTSVSVNSSGMYTSGTVNAASHTVGTSVVANSSGVYTSGTVNAASVNTGVNTLNANGVTTTANVNLSRTQYSKYSTLGGNTVLLGVNADDAYVMDVANSSGNRSTVAYYYPNASSPLFGKYTFQVPVVAQNPLTISNTIIDSANSSGSNSQVLFSSSSTVSWKTGPKVLLQQIVASGNPGSLYSTNCFSSAFANYQIVVDGLVPSTATWVWMRVCKSDGVFQSGNNYYWGTYTYSINYGLSHRSASDVQYIPLSYDTTSRVGTDLNLNGISCQIDVIQPFNNQIAFFKSSARYLDATSSFGVTETQTIGQFRIPGAAYITGIQIAVGAGNIQTGQLKIYGYN